MRIGVVTDIHGNLPALEAILAAFSEERVEQIINLGDTVGLGPDPRDVLEVLMEQSTPMVTLFGNHDHSVLGREIKQPELIRPIELLHHEYIKERLDRAHLEWIARFRADYRDEINGHKILATHYPTDEAGLLLPVVFQPDRKTLERFFPIEAHDVILYGHHHDPHTDSTDALIVNPGSAGCPHERRGVARAGVLDISGQRPVFSPILAEYDVEPVIERLKKSRDPSKALTLRIFFGVEESEL